MIPEADAKAVIRNGAVAIEGDRIVDVGPAFEVRARCAPDTTIRAGHPATEVTPLLPIDDGLLMNQLAVWAPNAGVRRKILVENPARLYGF